jgi:hypothetical protein
MSKQVLTNLDFNYVSKVINLPDPSSAQEAATKGYTDTAISNANSSNAAALAAEAAARLAADTALQASIDAESAARASSDTAISTSLSNEVSRALAAEGALDAALTAETTARTNEDLTFLKLNGLRAMEGSLDLGSHKVVNLSNGVDAADAVNKSQLDAEATRAMAAESTLTADLSAEVSRAQGAETAITNSLNSEISRATSAEGTLTTNLSNEVSRATTAEAGLSARLGVLEADPTTKTYVDTKFTAAESYTDQKIADLVNNAPEMLNTLSELATALQNEESAIVALTTTVAANLTEAKSYTDTQVAAEASSRVTADNALDARLDILEADPVTKSYVDTQDAAEATARSAEDLTFLKLNGSRAMSADLDVGSHKVINVITPTASTDATNKAYVDAATAHATTTFAGTAEIATQGEVNAGTVGTKFVTPETLANWAYRIKKVAETIGDGVNSEITVTHSLNSFDVQVQVFRAVSPYDTIECDVERASVDSVVLRFASAPATNSFRVVVTG